MGFRFAILILGVIAAYSSLVFKLFNLQIQSGDYYSVRAESQYRMAGFLEPQRGNIYFTDKNDNLIPAAINKQYPVIFVVPKEVDDIEGTAKALASLLGIDENKIKTSLIKSDDLYELLLAKATAEQVSKVKSARLKGVYIDAQNLRFYPFNDLASHALGFVGLNDQDFNPAGRYGLELNYNESLKGRPGEIKGDKVIKSIGGEDLVLTIDRNIQSQAEKTLTKLIESYDASGGTVIVQEPSSGKILALGNFPNFDPNDYSKFDISSFLNPAVQSLYEPGSVLKVITMAAGIDSGKLTPETTFIDNGSITLNGRTIKNWDLKTNGKVTMTEVIEKSINTGAVFAERKTGHDIFFDYLVKFGFDEPAGIDLPAESAGNLKSLKYKARDINFATASFGQGISITPLQLINAISAIANGGLLMKPYITQEETPLVTRRVISPETAGKVTKMMSSAVRKAQVAQIANYEIAGKTGTAQIPDFKKGGYSEEYIHTYAGFAPASNPRFTILLKLDKPNTTLAAMTVVPAFKELAQFILNYYNILPDQY